MASTVKVAALSPIARYVDGRTVYPTLGEMINLLHGYCLNDMPDMLLLHWSL